MFTGIRVAKVEPQIPDNGRRTSSRRQHRVLIVFRTTNTLAKGFKMTRSRIIHLFGFLDIQIPFVRTVFFVLMIATNG